MEGLSTFIFVANGKKNQFKLLWDVEERTKKIISYFLDAKILSLQGREKCQVKIHIRTDAHLWFSMENKWEIVNG